MATEAEQAIQAVAQKLHDLLREDDVKMGTAVSALSVVLGMALGHVAREDSPEIAQAVLVNIVNACLSDIAEAGRSATVAGTVH